MFYGQSTNYEFPPTEAYVATTGTVTGTSVAAAPGAKKRHYIMDVLFSNGTAGVGNFQILSGSTEKFGLLAAASGGGGSWSNLNIPCGENEAVTIKTDLTGVQKAWVRVITKG